MGKKIKSFATLLVALSTAFSIAALISCSETTDSDDPTPSVVDSATLVSIAVTSLPNKTTFNVGESFRYSGLEITATYDDDSTAVVTGYVVETPDMDTAGTKDVNISYTEGSVTVYTSYQIIVEAQEYVSIAIDSSWTLQVGMEVSTITPTVSGTLNTGQTSTLSSDLYTVSISTEDGSAVSESYIQGESTYVVTVALVENASITDTETYTTGSATSFKYEAEDAVSNGVAQLQENHSHGYFDTSMGLAYTSDGSSYSGGTLTFTVYALAGTYDLSFNAGSMLCYNTAADTSEDYGLGNSSYYDQIPNAVNDTIDLTVNGEEVSIPDTAVFTDLIGYTGSLGTFLKNFSVIELTNVTLQNGANELVFTLGSSKSGLLNRWSNPGSFNIDYIQFDAANPKDESSISSIEVETMPWVTTYNEGDSLDMRGLLLKVNYADGTSGYVCNNYTTSFDSSPGYQDVTVTYGDVSTTYQVYVRGDPDSISIDDSFTLKAGDDLTSLDLTVYGKYDEETIELDSTVYEVTITDEDGLEVSETTAQFGKTYVITASYELSTGSILTSSVTRTANMVLYAEDATYEGGTSRSNDASNTLVEFDLGSDESGYITFTTDAVEAGTYNLSMELFNGKVYQTSTSGWENYDPQDMNLDNVLDITINGSDEVDLTDKVLPAFTNVANSSSVMRNENNKILFDFGNVTLEEGENTIRVDVSYNENEANRWSAVLIGFDTCIISTAT